MGGVQTPAPARSEQEIPASEAAKRRNGELNLSRRKRKTIHELARRENETPNNEENLDPAADSDQSVVRTSWRMAMLLKKVLLRQKTMAAGMEILRT